MSTYSAVSKVGPNEDFVYHQQLEVCSMIDRQECNFIALLIRDVMLGVTGHRAMQCSVTERIVDYSARIHYLYNLNSIWRHVLLC